MTTEKLLEYHLKLTTQAREIMKQKNHDYAGASGLDPFSNFKLSETLGICSTEKSFLIRVMDKFKRLITFADAGKLEVKNESAQDACMDIINYMILLSAYLDEKQKGENKNE